MYQEVGAVGWTMTGFEEDPVYQAINLLGFSDNCAVEIDNGVDRFDADREISQMMNSLKLTMVEEKQQQIDMLKGQLNKQQEEKNDLEGKLVGYITLVHSEMAKFLSFILNLAEENLMEFLGLVRQLGLEFEGDSQNLCRTKKLMQKVNFILSITVGGLKIGPEDKNKETSEDIEDFENNLTSEVPSKVVQLENGPETPEQQIGERCTYRTSIRHGKDILRSNVHLQQYFCLCGNRYTHASCLYRHVKSIVYRSNFRCDVCSKRFPFASNLRNHKFKIHGIGNVNQATTFTCSLCHQEFNFRRDHRRHLKEIHGGQKRLGYAVEFASSFEKVGNKANARQDYGGKYKCSVCGNNFRNLMELNAHKMTIHSVKVNEKQKRVNSNTTSGTMWTQIPFPSNTEIFHLIDAEPGSSVNGARVLK